MASTQVDRLGSIPLAPVGLTATPVPGGFTLNWTAATDPTVVGYDLSVAAGSGQEFAAAFFVYNIAQTVPGQTTITYSPGYGNVPLTVFLQAVGSGGAGPAASVGVTPIAGQLILGTIAALRALLTNPSSVWVEGYYAPGDGGGGLYLVGTPATDNGGTIINDASGRSWYLQTRGQPVFVEQFGAGDGSPNDAPAINAALADCSRVAFTTGKTYKITSALVVPVTCLCIDGSGATVNGPGTNVIGGTSGVTVDGFTFTNFYQGGGEVIPVDSFYHLPSVKNCRNAIVLENAAWVNIRCQYIQFCSSGIFVWNAGSSPTNYCYENFFDIGTLEFCTNGIAQQVDSAAGGGIQGCQYRVFYMAANTAAIAGNYPVGAAQTIFNNYEFVVCDFTGAPGPSSGYHVVSNNNPGGGNSTYDIACNLVSFPGTQNPFLNVGPANRITVGTFSGGSGVPLAWQNVANDAPRTRLHVGGVPVIVYVSTTGSDTTGTGNSAAPFATINGALAYLQDVEMLAGTAAVIQLMPGTYGAAVQYMASGGQTPRGIITIAGSSGFPTECVLSGGVNLSGPGAYLVLNGIEVNTVGIVSQYGSDVLVEDVTFGPIVANPHMLAQNHGRISLNNNYAITGGASAHFQSASNGLIAALQPIAVALTGTPDFSVAFAASIRSGTIYLPGVTYSGSATGQQFNVTLCGVVDTNGASGSLPGSGNTQATGGQIN